MFTTGLTVRMGVSLDNDDSPVLGKERCQRLGTGVSGVGCTENNYGSHGLRGEAFCDDCRHFKRLWDR